MRSMHCDDCWDTIFMFLTTRVTACRLPITIVGNNICRLLCGAKNYFAYNDEIIITLRLYLVFLGRLLISY